ncbi:hypothetical protein M409DRAFT_23837 [Zasmidium cellare ATCC 36951]|uniref:tRNA(Ile)-lysidine synthetase n=1 Tax=Zasmidium cellare ATCC 36951 TaxID=1080233 RepID=A0A6A6CK74_ZASCE|nr:uncharacterized protein M409DRAFT_23837 [Zasmidium cellare ATCC 36951]KAF2166109.1 hypothetical protein M409DRAFT_23837 [Zasmidium cellare ATCC 36951]
MALAAVCSDLQTLHPTFQGAFRGFIVDHGVRKGSDEEARKVATELERIGISAKVLKLTWGQQDPKTATNFETRARKLRYRALGTACWDARISKLLVAHHADDQAETILSRVVSGYMGSGLQGIKKYSQIPECEGIYGVDTSGWERYHAFKRGERSADNSPEDRSSSRGSNPPWCEAPASRVERGGVSLHRPLLPFTKEDLILLCRAKGVQWVEDQTNKDKTLTQRNTIRHLMKSDALPAALQRESLSSMATKLRQDNGQMEREVERLYHATPIKLHIRTGKAVVDIDYAKWELPFISQEEAYHVKAMFLRKLLLLVSPCSDIALPDLDHALDLVFPEATPSRTIHSTDVPARVQIAEVNFQLHVIKRSVQFGTGLTLCRAHPMRTKANSPIPMPRAEVPSDPTPWVLWDSRFWLRLAVDPIPDISFEVRFLTPKLVGEIRHKLGKLPGYASIPARERWTLPVIMAYRHGDLICAGLPTVAKYVHAEGSQHALPTAQLLHGALECRYKNVDLHQDSITG